MTTARPLPVPAPLGPVSAWVTLEDAIQHPGLMLPPPTAIPYLAWRGRLTCLYAPEKSGKSTLVRQAAAAKVRGGAFLGVAADQGLVVWLALDEPLGDVVRDLYNQRARTGVVLTDLRPEAADLERQLQGADLVVIDTLTDFGRGLVDNWNDAAQVNAVLAPLRDILRRTDCAGILIHHAKKSGESYAGSHAIGAVVDVLAELAALPDHPTGRLLRCRGRGVHHTLHLAFDNTLGYVVSSGELPLELRVYQAIDAGPGISLRGLRETIGGRAGAVDDVVRDLRHRKVIENRSADPRKTALFLAHAEKGPDTLGHAAGHTPPKNPGHAAGHAGTRSRDTLQTLGGVRPLTGGGRDTPPKVGLADTRFPGENTPSEQGSHGHADHRPAA